MSESSDHFESPGAPKSAARLGLAGEIAATREAARQAEALLRGRIGRGDEASDADVDDDQVDDAAALRWRHALLRLSETFLDAAEERRDLSPILLGALHNALEQLLIHGNDDDLMALEEWLGHEVPIEEKTISPAEILWMGDERRGSSERRGGERRGGDRRAPQGRRAYDRT